jgi:hypothetical protein
VAPPNVMNREPIFWTTTTHGYNDSDRQRVVIVDDVVNGKKIKKRAVEKFPQRGHLGDYEDRRIAPGERWMLVVRHDGHEVRAVLTNGAAHMDSATGYGKYVRTKAAALGWYNPAQCPCALRSTGALRDEHIFSEEARTGTPCPPNMYNVKDRCPHSVAEKKARVEAHSAIQDQREEEFKTKEDKILDAMKEQAVAQREQTAALVERVMAADPTPVPPKPKKGE